MPNWVDNNVKIKGSKENIKKFSEALDKTMEMTNYSSEDKEVRSYVRICESIFPQPEELSGIREGRNQNADLFWWDVDENGKKVIVENFEQMLERDSNEKITTKNLTIEEMIDFTIKYKSFNWYDWRLIHWGSKTGDLYTEMKFNNDNEIELFCESAWDPLRALFIGVSNKYDLDVTINWIEESGYYGTFAVTNGNVTKDDRNYQDRYNIDYIANMQEGDIDEEE